MPLRKPWMRLVPLGTLAAVGLSACATLSPHRAACPPQVTSTPAVVPGPAAPDSSASADVGPPPAPPAPPIPGKMPGLNPPGLRANDSYGATPPQSPSPGPSTDTNWGDVPPQRPSEVPSRLGQHMSPPDSEASPDAPPDSTRRRDWKFRPVRRAPIRMTRILATMSARRAAVRKPLMPTRVRRPLPTNRSRRWPV